MGYRVKIVVIRKVTHDTKRVVVEKPQGYQFVPGQATDVAINMPIWKEKKRPFSFTSLNSDPFLEFTIKQYLPHNGVTKAIHQLRSGEELLIGDPWGAISYNGNGVFIAAGTGITPFIGIFRQLKKDNKLANNSLLFSNKTQNDIILEKEMREMFGSSAVFTLTREKKTEYEYGRITREFIKKYVKEFNQHFYLCGPWQFVVDIKKALDYLGVPPEKVTIEI